MPDQIQPALALAHIEEIVAALEALANSFDPTTQSRINDAYSRMLAEYPVDGTRYLQGSVVARFIQVLDELPRVRELIGDLIDATRGPVLRGGANNGDATLLDRLPLMLPPPAQRQAAAPPRAVAPPPAAAAPSVPSGAWAGARTAPQSVPPSPAVNFRAHAPTTRGGFSEVEEAAPTAAAEVPAALTRYPNLDCPDQAVISQRVSLFVQLLVKPADPAAAGMTIQDTGVSDQLPEVELVVRAPGCTIEGGNTRILQIDRNADSEERFVLVPQRLGQEEIRVDFYQHGRRIGTERRNVLVVEQPQAAEVPQPPSSGPLDLTIQPTLPPPDLELCIEVDPHDGRTLIFELHSTSANVGYNHAKVGKVTLQGSPLGKMQSVYDEMSKMARVTGGTPDAQRLAEERLAAIGNDLWDELMPDELKRQYWRFRANVKSILITSDEPWVPWEVLKPHRVNDDGEREEAPFMCQQFAIARWLSGPCAADELPVGTARPVAPTQVNLASVQEEVSFIEQLTTLHQAMVPLGAFSQRLQVLDWLKTGGFSVLHFACHGQFDATLPNDSAITLSDGPLRPSDIRAYLGKGPRPLVFINACHGARMDMSFTGLGGWADRFVKDVCVGAFVGAMWEVNDALALQFARRFYTELLKEQAPIATAFQAAREEIRQAAPGNSTWLAYVLYADPLARVEAS